MNDILTKNQCKSCKDKQENTIIINHENYKDFVKDIQDICRYPRFINPGNKWFISHKNIYIQFKSEVISFSHTKNDIFIVADKILGSGAFGVVKLCYNIMTHKSYALKIQSQHKLEDMERIKNQVDGNKLFGMGINTELQKEFYGPILKKETNKIYYAMPLAECSFFDKLNSKNMSLITALSYLYGVIDQLNDMHQQGKIHMDVKLDNILIIDGKAYLSDFGLIREEGTIVPTFIVNGKNKSIHMPPECFYSAHLKNSFFCVSKAIDCWSVGIMIENIFTFYKEPIQLLETVKFARQKLLRGNPKNRKSLYPLLHQLKLCIYNLYISAKK